MVYIMDFPAKLLQMINNQSINSSIWGVCIYSYICRNVERCGWYIYTYINVGSAFDGSKLWDVTTTYKLCFGEIDVYHHWLATNLNSGSARCFRVQTRMPTGWLIKESLQIGQVLEAQLPRPHAEALTHHWCGSEAGTMSIRGRVLHAVVLSVKRQWFACGSRLLASIGLFTDNWLVYHHGGHAHDIVFLMCCFDMAYSWALQTPSDTKFFSNPGVAATTAASWLEQAPLQGLCMRICLQMKANYEQFKWRKRWFFAYHYFPHFPHSKRHAVPHHFPHRLLRLTSTLLHRCRMTP